jgi:SpoVK/Ycf46/Vps4 family AAA+-type ATPase
MLSACSQILKDFELADDFPFNRLAECTPRFSSSDLKELCRNAAMIPVREMIRQTGGNVAMMKEEHGKVRRCAPLCIPADIDADTDGLAGTIAANRAIGLSTCRRYEHPRRGAVRLGAGAGST